MLNVLNTIIKICLISMLYACSSKPVLYPNSKLKELGKTRADQDIERCLADADDYLESPKAKKILGSAGKGAIFGTAVGAVSGLLTGDFTRGLTSGAAVGATAGAAGEAISPDQLKRSFVNRCLADKGYQVLGWE